MIEFVFFLYVFYLYWIFNLFWVEICLGIKLFCCNFYFKKNFKIISIGKLILKDFVLSFFFVVVYLESILSV